MYWTHHPGILSPFVRIPLSISRRRRRSWTTLLWSKKRALTHFRDAIIPRESSSSVAGGSNAKLGGRRRTLSLMICRWALYTQRTMTTSTTTTKLHVDPLPHEVVRVRRRQLMHAETTPSSDLLDKTYLTFRGQLRDLVRVNTCA